jgi:hypothetical protein
MVDRTHPGNLFELAQSAAEDTFDTDSSTGNADKVCAVALRIASDQTVSYFSGGPGYNKLVARVGGNKKDAQRAVTDVITQFLKSAPGGSFTQQQITHTAYADHGRGAMNCAEPKVWYHIRKVMEQDPADWVIVPFNKLAEGGGLVYNPPCRNCRRWVYGQFHTLSRTIALAYGGPTALDP